MSRKPNAVPSTVPEYGVWENMNSRCLNPKSEKWKDYGGRGITICPQWLGLLGFQRFYDDMGPRPTPRHQLDRRDNDGPYSPDNCRWVVPEVQQRNKRTNRRLTLDGETLTLTEWAARLGLTAGSLHERLERGWDERRALTTPPRAGNWHRG